MMLGGQGYEDKDIKTKKLIKVLLVLSVFALFVVLGLYWYIYTIDSQTMKMTVDSKQTAMAEDLFIIETGGKIYVSVQDFAKLVGYEYYQGEYNKYNEDTSQCYLESKNEIAGFEVGSNKLYKIDPTDTIMNYEWYELDEPVKLVNNKIYCTSDSIETACNVLFEYVQEKNRIQITTLDEIVSYYQQLAVKQFGYTGIDTSFENKKAILHGMMVILKAEVDENGEIVEGTSQYGVVTTENRNIIGTKYDKIEFMEVTQEFLVTSNQKLGILSSEGAQKIDINYDEIEILDNELRLYHVANKGLKGVLDKNGKRIVYLEHSQIGIDASLFKSNDITNNMLLFNNCIPVMKNEKWGLFDKNGNQLLDTICDSMGYVSESNQDTGENNLLIIPEINGIVIGKDGKYGVISSTGQLLLACQFDKIYSITNLGKDTYYFVYGTQTITLEELKNQLTQTQQPIEQEQTPAQDQTITNTIQ